MTKKTVFIAVTGRVQGVGFRYFTRSKAEETGITGWVKNTVAGEIEIEASGDPQNLHAFIDWIKTGPARAVIKTVSVAEIPDNRAFTNFTIR
jgi:acylphosphatase